MRNTLDISEALIKEAMRVTGAKTKSQVIKEALEAQIKRAKRQRLLSFKGKIDLDIDLDVRRDRK
ncbi:MAG TPA: type II toxin-antitoxin system VapB family antitoxin [Cyclobacteriaceae bacterium]